MTYFHYQSKRIYYKETGNGKPLIMLHGDTASSNMFDMLLPLYQEHYRVILIDFLGNGKSDRVKEFPTDLWISQAHQVIALIQHLKLEKTNVIGTSGGAWTAVNIALERPDLIEKVVADSFDGRSLHNSFVTDLQKERESAKRDVYARQFYEWCQGKDWQYVVDLNTQALINCASNKIQLFSKPLENLLALILFIGSKEDEMCRKDMQKEYMEMKNLVAYGRIHMFDTGGHPAIITNAKKAAEIILSFLDKEAVKL